MKRLLLAAFLAVPSAALAADAPVTFTKDVAPILYKSCVECHRPTMFAPMSLMTFEDARPWARVDQAARRRAHDAAVGRRSRARHVQERPAPVGARHRDDREVGRCRRAEGRRQGPAGGAAVRRRLDDRQAGRRLHDGRGVHDSAERRDPVQVLPRADQSHRRQVDSGDRDQARRARAGPPRDRVHAAGGQPAEAGRRARADQHRRRDAEQAGARVRAGRGAAAPRQLGHRDADALHDERHRDQGPHARSGSSTPSSRRRRWRAAAWRSTRAS